MDVDTEHPQDACYPLSFFFFRIRNQLLEISNNGQQTQKKLTGLSL